MTIDNIFDHLDEISDRIRNDVALRDLDVDFPDGAAFSVTRIGKHHDDTSTFYATLLVETGGGLRIPLIHQFHDGTGGQAFDRDRLTRDCLATIEALATDARHDDHHRELVHAVDGRFAEARLDQFPLSLLATVVRPISIGDADPKPAYELTIEMLNSDLAERAFVMRVSDAADFNRCYFEEIAPEQRARAARSAGHDVPEATND